MLIAHRARCLKDEAGITQQFEVLVPDADTKVRSYEVDLDLQLKTHGIYQLIVIGLIAQTCVEATVRFAADLGYQVTVVKDATASYSAEHMHAALDVNIPNYAIAIVSTEEIVTSISTF